MEDDEEEDDEKDMIADEIFTGDGDNDGELEEGEAVDIPLNRQIDDEEEGEDEESGKSTRNPEHGCILKSCLACYHVFSGQSLSLNKCYSPPHRHR